MSRKTIEIGGVSIVSLEIAPLARSLEDLLRIFDQSFSHIAMRLPTLMGEVRSMTSSLEELYTGSGSGELSASLNLTREMSERFKSELEAVLKFNEYVLKTADPLLEAVHSVASTLQEIDSLSDDIGLIGLNASVMAVRSGSEGAAFAALTQALTQLTESSTQVAARFRDASERIYEEAHSMMSVQQSLESNIKAVASSWKKQIEQAVEGLEELLRSSREELKQLSGRASDVLNNTHSVMLSIQRQDILRQGLEHIVTVLRAVEEEYIKLEGSQSPETTQGIDFLVFSKKIMSLSSRVLVDIGKDLRELYEEVDIPLNELASINTTLREAQEQMLDTLSSSLNESIQLLLETVSRTHSRASDFDAYREAASRLTSFAESVPTMLRELAEIVRHLRVINVLIKAEVARSHALKRAHSITGEIDLAQQTFGKFVSQAEDSLSALKQTLEDLDEAIDEVGSRRQKLEYHSVELRNSIHELESSGSTMREDLSRLGILSQTMNRSIGAFRHGLGEFSDSISATHQVQQACEQILGELTPTELDLRNQGGLNSYEPQLGSLTNLVEKFTVYSHKLAAGEMVDMDIEEGQDEGELTLF